MLTMNNEHVVSSFVELKKVGWQTSSYIFFKCSLFINRVGKYALVRHRQIYRQFAPLAHSIHYTLADFSKLGHAARIWSRKLQTDQTSELNS
jgi:hypothetical protein